MEERPETSSKTKTFEHGEESQQKGNGVEVMNTVGKLNRELLLAVSHHMSNK